MLRPRTTPAFDGNGGGTILSIVVAAGTVTGGGIATGTVTLTGPAPAGGVVVTLVSNDPHATVPSWSPYPLAQ